ncbi:uncharacterized protein [Anabrus simplex]|uniref:uncharacterized protein n=1 Tax=Anabrus simplex TaxID=316456 RepID=UPI0035A386B3
MVNLPSEKGNMEGMKNEDETHAYKAARSLDVCAATTLEDQILIGVVESLTDDAGVISFSFSTQIKKARFSRSNVVIDNMKLTKKISLLNILKIGMQVTFSVEYSNKNDGVNFEASLIEVKGPVKCPQCSPEEIKYVHNKVFCGNIESLDGFSGTIIFELDNRSEKAVFSKECVYVSDKRLKDNPVPLIVGKPVYLMVVHYSGVIGCNFMAIVVQTASESELNLSTSVEGNVLLHHSMLYGTIRSVNEISGKIAFQAGDREKEILFDRSSVIINKLKLVKNVPLPSVLTVGMPVSFMIYNSSVSVFAKAVEVFQDECSQCSYSGLLGTITALRALSGTITFLINNEERRALFLRKSVVIGNEKINESQSLLTVLKIGLNVVLEVVGFEENNSDFIATSVVIPSLTDLVCPFTVDRVVSGEVLSGIIQKIGNEIGIVGFHIGGKSERAIFFRNSVFINKERILVNTPLSDLLHISMPVSIKVIHCSTPGFNFIAISVEVLQENICNHIPSAAFQEMEDHHGTLLDLNDYYGIITFSVDSVEEKAVIYRSKLFINDKRISKKTSLLKLLHIGMPVSFTPIRCTGSKEYSYKVTHLKVLSLTSSPLLALNEAAASGAVPFQIDHESGKEILCKNDGLNVREQVKSELLSSFSQFDPSAFRMEKAGKDNCFVGIESLPDNSPQPSSNVTSVIQSSCDGLQQLSDVSKFHQKPFECRGIIKQLFSSCGVASFQLNNSEEKAVFLKKSVHICDMKLQSHVLLSDVLEIDLQVLMTVEKCKEIPGYHFRATLVHIENPSKCYLGNAGENSIKSQLFKGTVQKVGRTCGIIKVSMSGKNENSIFFNHSVMINSNKLDENVSLLSILKPGTNVSLRVNRCTKLHDCNFVAVAVEIGCSNTNIIDTNIIDTNIIDTNIIDGTIVSLEAKSGVVTFQKENKQQKAIFYKKSVRLNGIRLKGKVSLLSVLQVGMCVLLQVEKLKHHCFNFKALHVHVKNDMKDAHNVAKVSASKHIECGIGIVKKIISSTEAQLQFELEELKNGLFKLSDFFVNGQRCDDSRQLSTYISENDVYFFDATRNNKNEGNEYLITCVWQGKKPGLLTLLEPYQILKQKCQQVPSSAEGTVIALFPPQAAIVETEVCGAVLLYIDSLMCNNDTKRLSTTDWIQDYLSVGDILTLELNKHLQGFSFPLVECARKTIRSRPISQQKSHLISEPNNNSAIPIPVVSASNVGGPSASTHSGMSSPSHSVGKSNSPFIRKDVLVEVVSEAPDVDNRLVYGSIEGVTNQSGVVKFHLDNNKVERASFRCKNVSINKIKHPAMMMIIEVGMHASLMVKHISDSEYCKYEAMSVNIEVPDSFLAAYGFETSSSPKQDVLKNDQTFCGFIYSLTDISGTIAFKKDDKNYRAIFSKNAVRVNNTDKVPPKVSLLKAIKVGMDVVLTLEIYHGIFKAKHVNVISSLLNTSEDRLSTKKLSNEKEICKSPPLLKVTDLELKEKEGKIIGYLSSSIGMIECSISGEKHEARFLKDIVSFDQTVHNDLQKLFPLGETVKFDGKFESFMDKQKLRILCIWHQQASKKMRRKLWNFGESLTNGKEYSGTVIEILKSNTFVVAIKNVLVLVCKNYLTEPAKYISHFASIEYGDKISVVIQKRYRKGKYNWIAIDAWKTRDNSDISITQPKKTIDPAHGLVLEAELVTVAKGSGVLLDSSDGINFHSSDAYLFGVSLKDVDLTQLFKPGDVFNYSISKDSQVTKVWFGPRQFEGINQQFHRLHTFCVQRSIDASLLSFLTKELGNQKELHNKDAVNVNETVKPSHEHQNKAIENLDQAHGQLGSGKRKSLKPTCDQYLHTSSQTSLVDFQHLEDKESLNASPKGTLQRKCVKSVPDQQAPSSCKNVKSPVPQCNLDSGKNQNVVSHDKPSDFGEIKESSQQLITESSDVEEQFKCLRQQLSHLTCPVLTEDVKQFLTQFLLSLAGKDICSEVHNEVVDRIVALIECRVKDCISEHLLSEVNRNLKNGTLSLLKEEQSTLDKLQRNVQWINALSSKGNGTSWDVVHKLGETKVCVDQGTQTMSTGPVLCTRVFPK